MTKPRQRPERGQLSLAGLNTWVLLAAVGVCSYRVGCDCTGGPSDAPPCGVSGRDGGAGDAGLDAGLFPPSCANNVVDGDEPDVDCGGPCLGCSEQSRCLTSNDCASLTCDGGRCEARPCALPLPFPGQVCVQIANLGTPSGSSTWMGNAPANAIDGNCGTAWNAGVFPLGWWRLDFPALTSVSGLTLVPEMLPNTSDVTHVIEVSSDGTAFTALATWTTVMTHDDAYVADFRATVPARALRISTTFSSSWPAWREVAVWSCP